MGQRVDPDLAVAHDRLIKQPAQEAQVGANAEDERLVERGPQACERLRARRAVGNQLGEERVVSVRDEVALANAGLDPHAVRPADAKQAARGGQEAGVRVLRVQARLDGVAAASARRTCLKPSGSPGGDPQLVRDDVAAGHRLGDRVLDLQPVFISQKKNSPSSVTRNSTVPALT